MPQTTTPFENGWTVVSVVRTPAVVGSLPDGNFSGVVFKAPGPTDDAPNTVAVYLGKNDVTADQNAETGGFPLAPGESITVPLLSAEDVYVVASSSSQAVAWWLQ